MKNFKKIASLVLILLVVFLNRSTPSIGATVPILNGSFGSGSNQNDITSWEEKGDESASSTLAKNPDTLPIGFGEDIDDTASPDSGRFASIGRYHPNQGQDQDGSICQQIDATGYNSLVLKYYWRGDADAEDNIDFGKIEYLLNGSCESADNQWVLVTSHELDNGDAGTTAWSSLQSLNLPTALDDDEFFIRFRGSVSASDENFRVDGVGLEGTPIPSTLIVKKVVVNNSGGAATAASFSFKVNGGASTAFEADAQNNITVVPGTYSVVEDSALGYTTTYSGCSNVTVGIGQTKTCTITNNDKPDMCENIQGWQYQVPEGFHEDDDDCFPNTATISATKIVCDYESDLPNWGDGSPSTNITSSTAANFVAAHPTNCRLQSGWTFEWAPNSATNPGDQVGVAGGVWTPFGPTNGSGVTTTTVPYGASVWVREQANADYIPFSGDISSSGGWSDDSAEMYCGTDVANYDNYDKISSPNGGSTYHCVAFNVAKPDVCLNLPELQTTAPKGYHIIYTNDQSQCVPDFVDVQLCKTNDAGEPQPLSGWTVKLDGEGENDHQGVTGQDGCYTFNDIPYGNYTASEVMQEGWTQVSLPNSNGTIQAYELTNGPYTIVNHYNAPVCDPEVNLMQNGGFEAPALSPSTWSIIPDTNSLLKWLVSWVGTQTSGTLGLEIQNNVAGSPAEGSQHAELDGDHPVSIWQTVPTIPGKVYNLNFKYSARPQRDANDNKIEVKADGVTLGSVLSDDGTSLSNTSWGSQSRSFIATGATTKVEFVDTGTDTSFGGYLDAVSLACEPNPKATINAKKIVCDNEADLPNWGAGGADITATTATDYVAQHPSCHLEPWTFEWAPSNAGNPGDNTAVAGGVWSPFASTVQVPAGDLVWVREQTQSGYVPFTGQNTTQDVSAEIYCNTDVLNYDNYDWINPVEPLQTYYCVGFNAIAVVDMCPNIGGNQATVPQGMHKDDSGNCVADDQCRDTSMDVVSDTTDMVGGGNAFGPLTFIHSAWTAVINGAMWIWDGDGIANPTTDTTKAFTKNFTIVGTPADSSIDIASDNSYTVKINGNDICTDETEGDTDGNSFSGPDNCVVPASALVTGSNTLSITVRNWAVAKSTLESNPAGLMYKLHINAQDCPQTTGSIEIKKYVCPADFVPNRNDNGVGGSIPEGCSPQTGAAFGYVHGEQTDANAPYPELEMSLIPGGSTSAGVLTIPNLPATGRYLVKETDGSNLLGLYCEGDGDTNPNNNDNQELTFVPAGGVAHCVAYNKAPVVIEENPQCSDESDNDGDQLIDANDPGCLSGEGNSWNPNDDDESNDGGSPTDVCLNVDGMQESLPSNFHFAGEGICIPNGSSSDDGGGSTPPPGPSSAPQGEVLGASTTCTPYLEDYMKRGGNNRKEQVMKLQTFLNDYLKLSPPLPVNGIFGLQTFRAVVKFQEQESDLVLKPWIGITLKDAKKGTGWVFKTTRTRINNIMCPELNLQNPPLTLN